MKFNRDQHVTWTTSKKPKWAWRNFLTKEEYEILLKADKAKSMWRNLNRERAAITNRAIQRAKYAAR